MTCKILQSLWKYLWEGWIARVFFFEIERGKREGEKERVRRREREMVMYTERGQRYVDWYVRRELWSNKGCVYRFMKNDRLSRSLLEEIRLLYSWIFNWEIGQNWTN